MSLSRVSQGFSTPTDSRERGITCCLKRSFVLVGTLGRSSYVIFLSWCCCSLCCVRASLQSLCRVLWSCVLHSTSSVIVSRILWKLCYTPQALSLFPESWHPVLCLPLCLCPFLFVYCPPVYIYCSGLGTFPPVSFPPLQVSSFALLPLILVSFPPLQSPWCSVTQGPFKSHF